MTIGDVSEQSGVAASALRFYEERGLIHPERTESGHRRYHRDVLRRLAFIAFAQRMGLPLDEIGEELAKLPSGRSPTEEEWSTLSRRWAERLDQGIAELKRLRQGLNDCISCGCLSVERCDFASPGDPAERFSRGPRYWVGRDAPAE